MPQEKIPYKIGMVFGVFDGLHPGHRFFLYEASRRSEKLIVVLASQKMIQFLKQHLPHSPYAKRADAIRNFDPKLTLIKSDDIPEKWTAIKKYSPEVVFIGHDQHALATALSKIPMPYEMIDSHFPKKYKSSLLHKKESKNVSKLYL